MCGYDYTADTDIIEDTPRLACLEGNEPAKISYAGWIRGGIRVMHRNGPGDDCVRAQGVTAVSRSPCL